MFINLFDTFEEPHIVTKKLNDLFDNYNLNITIGTTTTFIGQSFLIFSSLLDDIIQILNIIIIK